MSERGDHNHTVDQNGPVHLCGRWVHASGEEAEDKDQHEEEEAGTVEEQAESAAEAKLGREERYIAPALEHDAANGHDV